MKNSSANVPYIESHSALRGIAALTVLMDHLRAFHFLPQQGVIGRLLQVFAWNDLAVFLFFILSGFVMGHVYPSPVHWRHFFVARLARLLPVYEVTLVVTCVLALLTADPDHIGVVNFIANALMIQQWFPVPSWFPVDFPSWSLSVEAFLYVFAFPLLIAMRRSAGKNVLYVLLIVIGALWGTFYYNLYRPTLFHYWYLPLLTGLCGFGTGFALQGLIGKGLRHPGKMAAIGLALIVGSLGYRVWFPSIASHGILAVGLIFLVAGSVDSHAWPYRLLARPFLLYLGDVSYSLYLWHFPVLMFLMHGHGFVEKHLHGASAILGFDIFTGLLAVALPFAIATLSYTKLEVPFRRLIRDRFVRARPGAAPA